MRQTLLVFFAVFVVSVSTASGQVEGQRRAQYGSAEQELKALDRAWAEATVRRDAVALEELLADDYLLTNDDAETVSRAQEIAGARAPEPELTFTSFRTEGVEVSIAGERATVTGRLTLIGRLDEEVVSVRYFYTRTFVRRGGGWRITTARMVFLPQDD